jgi:hypothetical protein
MLNPMEIHQLVVLLLEQWCTPVSLPSPVIWMVSTTVVLRLANVLLQLIWNILRLTVRMRRWHRQRARRRLTS